MSRHVARCELLDAIGRIGLRQRLQFVGDGAVQHHGRRRRLAAQLTRLGQTAVPEGSLLGETAGATSRGGCLARPQRVRAGGSRVPLPLGALLRPRPTTTVQLVDVGAHLVRRETVRAPVPVAWFGHLSSTQSCPPQPTAQRDGASYWTPNIDNYTRPDIWSNTQITDLNYCAWYVVIDKGYKNGKILFRET